MKPILVGLLAAGAVLAAAGSASAQIELKINGLHAPEHPASMTHAFFADRIEQLTDGEITVEVFDARQLGDAVESVQSLRNGTIALVTVSTSNLSQVDPRVDMFSLPYLFKSADHYWDYLNSDRALEFVAPLEEKGIVVLGWIDSGARNFFSDQPIRSVDDVQGDAGIPGGTDGAEQVDRLVAQIPPPRGRVANSSGDQVMRSVRPRLSMYSPAMATAWSIAARSCRVGSIMPRLRWQMS